MFVQGHTPLTNFIYFGFKNMSQLNEFVTKCFDILCESEPFYVCPEEISQNSSPRKNSY